MSHIIAPLAIEVLETYIDDDADDEEQQRIVCRIESQPDNIRQYFHNADGDGETYFQATNGIEIRSCNCPDWSGECLFVRGDNNNLDDRDFAMSEEEYTDMIEAITEFNNYVIGAGNDLQNQEKYGFKLLTKNRR